MENQDFIQSGNVNSSLPNLGQQQDNFFFSDLLQSPAPNLNRPGSFSDQIKELIGDGEIKIFEDTQNILESVLGSKLELMPSTNTSEAITNLNNYDILTGDVTSANANFVLDSAITTAKEQLKSFANDEKILDKMNLAFGDGWQPQEAYDLLQGLANGEAMPKIEILPAANLNANGAFGEGTIYLFENFLSENITNPKAVSSVLLEEVGHYLDRELNSVDSAGDEGKIFANLVQGETITGAELKALKTEDDSAIILFNGEKIPVELAEKKGKTGFLTLDAKYYLSLYPDLKNAFGDNYDAAVQHWLDYGIKEGRRSSSVFDVKYYLDTNPDLKNAFGDNYDAAVQHWLDYGTKEGRRGSVDFAAPPPFPGELLKYEPGVPLTYDENVKQWQERMKDLGKDIDVDGLYGLKSENAARAFQQEKGLAVDGIVGPETWEATFGTEIVTSSQLPFPGELLKYEPGVPLTYDENAKQWQQRMKDRGWDIDVDGLYGLKSQKVARAFQQEKGLAVDGIVGPETWAKAFRTDNLTPPDVTAPIPGINPEEEIPNGLPSSGKSINSAGLNLVKEFEGYQKPLGDGTGRVTTYNDPGGVLTIGFGHTGSDVTSGKIISRAEAEQLLREDLRQAEAAVSRLVTVSLNDNQFSALVSFVYNLGAGAFEQSTMLKLLNQSKYQEAADQFPRWNQDNGRVLSGLTRRRKEERQLFWS